METSTVPHRSGLRGPTLLLRLQSDDRLVARTRRGSQAAYETLVARYTERLRAFCRHILGSSENVDDVLDEAFTTAFGAMLADDRPINVRPWLYRIARHRCLDLSRCRAIAGPRVVDVGVTGHCATIADSFHEWERLGDLAGDLQTLPEPQRTALLLREVDALSYEEIADAMETTVPAIKSLLARARVSLAEAAEARTLPAAALLRR